MIANLIEYYLLENSIDEAIQLVINKMCGTWALGIVYTKMPETIYVTRHGSPLLLGYNDDTIICCSEIAGFIGIIYNYISLENNDIIKLTSNGYDSNIIYIPKNIDTNFELCSPAPFPHWTLKEINDQPKSILAAINNGARILDNNIILGGLTSMKHIVEIIQINHIIILGCGTSYHSAMLAKYYFNYQEDCKFTTIQAFDASEFSKSDIPNHGRVLSIFCSQSGETRDLIKCIEICREKNCILLGVVNVVDSFIAQNVDYGVYMNAGREVAVPSTKSFTSTLVILSLIGMWFNKKYINISIINTLRTLPIIIKELLKNELLKQKFDNIVNFININHITSIFILGKGKMFPITREIALKNKRDNIYSC